MGRFDRICRKAEICQAAAREAVEHRDTLLTIAEIAVALAGFASIVSVVAQRADESS